MSILNSKTSLVSFAKPRERETRGGEKYIANEAFGELAKIQEVLRAAELQGHNVYKLAVREYQKEGEIRYALELSTFEGKKQAVAA